MCRAFKFGGWKLITQLNDFVEAGELSTVARQTAYPGNVRSVVLEILHRFLMRLSGASGGVRPKISTLAGLGILLARVQTIFAGFQFSSHGGESLAL
jgi:hypothetical protein